MLSMGMERNHRKFVEWAAVSPIALWVGKIFAAEGLKLVAAFFIKQTWDRWRNRNKKQKNEQNAA